MMLLKYWRILVLIVMVIGAMSAVFLKPQYQGVQMAYVHDVSPAKGVFSQGMIISRLNGQEIKTVEQWDGLARNLKGNVTITADKKEYRFEVNESIGIDVSEIDRTNLEFGLDIKGGTRILLKPKGNVTEETMSSIVSTLQTRANIYGLREIKFIPVRSVNGDYFIQVEATGVGRSIVNDLLSKQGTFEARITKPVFLSGGKGIFQMGENQYQVALGENGSVTVGDLSLSLGDNFTLEEIDFQYFNISQSQDELFFLGKAYEGSDIQNVYSDARHSGVLPQGGVYSFYFEVLVSEKGAERFAKITSGIPSQVDLNSGDYYLRDCQILLYLDNQLVSSLRIASSLGGQFYTTPQITGGRETRDEANSEKLNLQTILRSGALPVGLEVASVGVISPTLGKNFVSSAMIAGVLAAIAMTAIVFVRYRKLRIAIPMALTSLAEVVIILGIAAQNDAFVWLSVLVLNVVIVSLAWWKKEDVEITAWIGVVLIPMIGLLSWTVDLPVIGGIIAAIGIGADNMVILADETLYGGGARKILYTAKDKIKRAFFIIFSSASTNIAAMVPLIVVGIGFVRGFAITTMVGTLVGVLITRQAYAKIIELGVREGVEKK